MRKNLISIFILIVIFSCKEKSKSDLDKNKVISIIEMDSIQERFFPEKKIYYQKDTLIKKYNIEISIIEKSLNSNVTDTFVSRGIKYIDHYRDTQFSISVKKGELTVLDTLFQKENFENLAGEELIEQGNFISYQLNKITDSEVEFFGMINKPETDWSFPFYHQFNFKNDKLEIVEINPD